MELRIFGRTGLELSALGFGCGAVVMVRGDPLDQERTIARAIGAVQYGNGESEKNLGRVLQSSADSARTDISGTRKTKRTRPTFEKLSTAVLIELLDWPAYGNTNYATPS